MIAAINPTPIQASTAALSWLFHANTTAPNALSAPMIGNNGSKRYNERRKSITYCSTGIRAKDLPAPPRRRGCRR